MGEMREILPGVEGTAQEMKWRSRQPVAVDASY
jgi:hypothetical protein